MSLIGEAFVRIRPDTTGFQAETTRQVKKDLVGVQNQARASNNEVTKLGRGALYGSGALRGLGRAAASASAAFLGGAGIVYGIKSASAAASNLNEQTSKSSVVFGQSQDAIVEWSKNSATALGLAHDQAIQAAAGFGALLRPLGESEQAAAANSQRLTQLAADLASFSNTSVADALQALSSGLVGEIEPLRRYGVILSETAVQQKALAMTGKDSAKQLTAQEKVAARLEIIFKQTSQAQGDFARTSGGLANQQRILQANLRDLAANIGATLNPVLLDVITNMNDWFASTKNQETIQKDLNQIVKDGSGILGAFAAGLGDVKSAWDKLPDFGKHQGLLDILPDFGNKGLIDSVPGLKKTIEDITRLGLIFHDNSPDPGWAGFFAGINSLANIGNVANKLAAVDAGLTPVFDNSLDLAKGGFNQPGFGKQESVAQRLARAVSAAGLTPTTSDDERALRAQTAQFQKGLDFALKQLHLRRGNLKNFSDDARALQDEIAANEATLAGFQADRDAAAEKRRKDAVAREKKRQQRILDDFKAGLRWVDLGVDVDPLTIGEVNKAMAKRLKAAKDKLTGAAARREDIASAQTSIAEQRFTNDKKLIPFIENELTVAQQTAKLLKRIGASKLDQLNEALHIATLRRRIRDIRNEDAQDAFSIQDLFGEGGRQFAAYGSNVAPLNQPLSRQESGGAAVRAAQAGGKTIQIVQNFIGARDAGQAIQEASNAARALRY